MGVLPGLQPTAMSDSAKQSVLQQCAWFMQHGIADLQIFCRYLQLYKVPGQHTLFHEGDTKAFMCILVKGEVTLIKRSQRGDYRSLAQLHRGQLFGEMALIDGACRTATASTAESSEILILDSAGFDTIRTQHPVLGSQLLYAFITTLTGRLRHSDGRLVDLTADYGELEQRSRQTLIEKNAELEAALEQARLSNQLKDQFLATISHELRTPMNGIEGALHLIDPTHLSEQDRNHLGIAMRSAAGMTQMVELLLEHTELMAGKTAMIDETIALRQCLLELVAPLRQRCSDKKLSLDVNIDAAIPDWVHTDPNRLNLILNQLLHNAVKFTHSGTVRFNATWDAGVTAQDGSLRVDIQDTGVGMDTELLPDLLQGFRQADSRFTRRFEGLGIGLSTCKKLLDLMDGELTLTSTPNQGTTVLVRIPMRIANCTKLHAQSATSPLAKTPCILIVEDNPVNQMIINKMVTAMGYDSLTASDGLQALEVLAQEPVDLILMDCQMPNLDGFEATQAIRKLDGAKAVTPIIAVTANAMARDRERCFDVGMNDYLKKPINRLALNEKIRLWLVPSS